MRMEFLYFFGSGLIDSAFRHFRQDALNLTKQFNKVCFDLVNLANFTTPIFFNCLKKFYMGILHDTLNLLTMH